MGSTRTSALIQIMQLENQINKIVNSKKYRNIQTNITLLNSNTGNSVFSVRNPEDTERKVEVRRNSKASKAILAVYEHQLNEYDILLEKLGKRKKKLTMELFK